MKNLIVIAILLICKISTAQNDTILKLFRSTTIQNKQKITLQSNIETLKNVTDKKDDAHYYLKKGTYVKADSIVIEVNKSKQIMAIKFRYEVNDTPYIDEIPFFQKTLNSKGTEFKYTSKNKSISVTKWEDSTTIFELAEVIIDGKKQTYSVIFDRELYFMKYVGLNKNENSIELLRFLGVN